MSNARFSLRLTKDLWLWPALFCVFLGARPCFASFSFLQCLSSLMGESVPLRSQNAAYFVKKNQLGFYVWTLGPRANAVSQPVAMAWSRTSHLMPFGFKFKKGALGFHPGTVPTRESLNARIQRRNAAASSPSERLLFSFTDEKASSLEETLSLWGSRLVALSDPPRNGNLGAEHDYLRQVRHAMGVLVLPNEAVRLSQDLANFFNFLTVDSFPPQMQDFIAEQERRMAKNLQNAMLSYGPAVLEGRLEDAITLLEKITSLEYAAIQHWLDTLLQQGVPGAEGVDLQWSLFRFGSSARNTHHIPSRDELRTYVTHTQGRLVTSLYSEELDPIFEGDAEEEPSSPASRPKARTLEMVGSAP